jgi:hypothetical protein
MNGMIDDFVDTMRALLEYGKTRRISHGVLHFFLWESVAHGSRANLQGG